MPAYAATTTGDHAALAALFSLAVTLWAAGWLLTCWLYPFTACRRCHGTGRRHSPFGHRTFGLCRRCHGDGRQLRPGRRLLNALRDLHRNGTDR